MTKLLRRLWRNRRVTQAVFAVYWLGLAISTHLPRGTLPAPPDRLDKLEHAVGFALLAWLLATAWQRSAGPLMGSHLRAAWITIALYAAVDEWTQPLVGRTCSLADWLADVAGAAVGLVLFAWWSRRRLDKGR